MSLLWIALALFVLNRIAWAADFSLAFLTYMDRLRQRDKAIIAQLEGPFR